MNSRQLHFFVQIAENGNLRKTAETLHISQPALTRYVRGLEDELGVKLFDRHPHGVKLTAAGEQLHARAVKILADMEEARVALLVEGGKAAGRIAIGAPRTLSRLLFPPLTARFRSDHPQVSLTLVESNYYQLLEGLDVGRLDLAIMVNVEPRADYALEPVGNDMLCLFGLPGALPDFAEEIGVGQLADLPLVAGVRPGGPRMMLERGAAERNVHLNVVLEHSSPEVVKAYVEKGLGLGVLTGWGLMDDVTAGRFCAVPIGGIRLTRFLVRRVAYVADSRRIDAAVTALRAEMQNLSRQCAAVFAP